MRERQRNTHTYIHGDLGTRLLVCTVVVDILTIQSNLEFNQFDVEFNKINEICYTFSTFFFCISVARRHVFFSSIIAAYPHSSDNSTDGTSGGN